MDPKNLKVIGYVLIVIMVMNIILFSFRIIGWQIFLVILAGGVLFVYVILPKLKK